MAQQASLKSQCKGQALAVLRQLNHVPPEKHAVRAPVANGLQLLPQPLYVNQTLACVLLHMDMLMQVAVVNQPVELRPKEGDRPSQLEETA